MAENKKIAFWIVLIFGILSLTKFLGIILSYTGIPSLDMIGKFLFIGSYFLLVPSIIVIVYLLIKKFPINVCIVPIFYVILPLTDWIISFVSAKIFGIPIYIYSSTIAGNFLFRIIANSYFGMAVNLVIFVYSIFILKQISSKGK